MGINEWMNEFLFLVSTITIINENNYCIITMDGIHDIINGCACKIVKNLSTLNNVVDLLSQDQYKTP